MHSVEKIEKYFRIAAVPVACISAWFTYCFAFSTMAEPAMGRLLGLALAICAFASAYIWTIRQVAIRSGATRSATIFLTIAGLLFTGTDAFTNAGSLLWQRAASHTEATFQNVTHEDARNAVLKAEERVQWFKDRISELKAQNPWVTSVSADGLRGQIPALEEAVRQEARRGGCGPKCLALQEKLADVQNRIATAEQLSEHEKMLEAASRGLEKAMAEAREMPPVVSATASQAESLARIFEASLTPSEETKEWTVYGTGLVMALFLTFAPMALNWVGYGGWRMARQERFAAPQKPIAPVVPQTASVPSVPAPERTERVVERHMLQPVHMGASLYELGQLQLGRVRPAAA